MNIVGIVLLLGGCALAVYLAVGLVKDIMERKKDNHDPGK